MLTFTITGAEGILTAAETLTSGMVGKQAKFAFSPEWEGLGKVAVFTAGTVTRDAVLEEDTVRIPGEVLQSPMRQLYVGVYGVSADGTVVIPTVRVKGPFIWPGATPSGDPGTDPELEIWAQMLQQMEQLKAEVEAGPGLDEQAAQLLIGILRNGVYSSDQSGAIGQLAELLGVYEAKTYSVSYGLNYVDCSSQVSSVTEGESFAAVLTPYEGYSMDAVTVSMGDEDVTAQVYADGVITIAQVTGDLIITASAVELSNELSVTWESGQINNAGVQDGGSHSGMIDVQDASAIILTTTNEAWTAVMLRTYSSFDAAAGASTGYMNGGYMDANDATDHPDTVTFNVSNVSFVRITLSNYAPATAAAVITVRKE